MANLPHRRKPGSDALLLPPHPRGPPDDPPAVGDAAAVASHAQTLLQVGREARGRDQTLAVGTLALLVLPLVVDLAEDVHAGLVHDFWDSIWENEPKASKEGRKKKKKTCGVLSTDQTLSCSLGPFHPGRSSPASRPGGPQNTSPSRRPPPAQSRCHGPRPGHTGGTHTQVTHTGRRAGTGSQSKRKPSAVSPLAWCCLVLTGAYPPFSFENRCG